MNFSAAREFALQLDSQDPLAAFRNDFVIHDPNLIYLDGNSLGMLPKAAQEKADALAAEFKEKLNIAKLEVVRISPVLGVHTGPGIVGAGIVPMELMSDLVK